MSEMLIIPRIGKIPVLDLALPRPVTAVHQIEITSRCNLRCVYCVSPDIVKGKYPNRPAVDMDEATFVRALEWVVHFVRAKTQSELNLAGIGESTMHPRFLDYLRMAREAVGDNVRLVFATNGLIASEEFVRAMVPYHPEVWVSLHRPEKAALAVQVYRAHGLAAGVSYDPSTNANDWAGQVNWHNSPNNTIPCPWLREGRAFVIADGRIGTCCLDATGDGVVGHVRDEIGSSRLAPYPLCAKCYQVIGVAGWNQEAGVAR